MPKKNSTTGFVYVAHGGVMKARTLRVGYTESLDDLKESIVQSYGSKVKVQTVKSSSPQSDFDKVMKTYKSQQTSSSGVLEGVVLSEVVSSVKKTCGAKFANKLSLTESSKSESKKSGKTQKSKKVEEEDEEDEEEEEDEDDEEEEAKSKSKDKKKDGKKSANKSTKPKKSTKTKGK